MSAGCVAHVSFETVQTAFRVCAAVYCSSLALFAKPLKIYKAFYRLFIYLFFFFISVLFWYRAVKYEAHL